MTKFNAIKRSTDLWQFATVQSLAVLNVGIVGKQFRIRSKIKTDN